MVTALRVVAYHPNGDLIGPLPTPEEVQASYPLNDLGGLTLSYAVGAPRHELLGQPLEMAVQISHTDGDDWTEPPSSRFLYLRDGRDPVKTGDAYAVEGASYLKRLEKALVGFRSLNAEGNRVFSNATPGAIMSTLITEAQARGALTGMSVDFTATHDSAGVPWPTQIATFAVEPGKHLLDVLLSIVGMGYVDTQTQGRTVQMYVAESLSGMGVETPVILRPGRDLTEAPFRRTWEGLADTAIVHGDNGTNVTRTNATALKPWGRQETYATASGVTDTGTLQAVGDAVLEQTGEARSEHTFGLDFRATPHLPFRDYGPGNWVKAVMYRGEAAQLERMRVMQVTLVRDTDGRASGNVVLNDRFVEADVRTSRRLDRILNGSTENGTGGPPTTSPGGNDILAPGKPLGVTASTAVYVDDSGRNRAQVTLNWDDVTTNADGTNASDVDHYEVWRRPSGGAWIMVGTSAESIYYTSGYDPGSVWDFRVRAVDGVWNRGQFSDTATVTSAADTIAPPRPSQPTVTTRLGTASVIWDGALNTPGALPQDYRLTEYHVSDTNNPAQDPSVTRVGDTRGAGYAVAGPLTYGATYYAWVVLVDSSGNRSQASPVRTFTVAPLVDVSNFPDDAMEELYARTAHFINVTSDMLAANSVTAMAIAAGAVTVEKLTVESRRPTVLPNSWMEGVHPTENRPRFWDLWYYVGPLAALSFSPTPITGTRSLRVTAAADASWTVGSDNGNWLPVVGGQVWTVRALVRPVSDVPAGKQLRLRLATSAPGVNPIGFTGDRLSQDVVLTGPLLGGNTYTLADTFKVPATHTQATVAIVSDAMGVPMVTDWDGIELSPGTTDADVTEIGPGRIKTGVLQATTRMIAGTETGSRVETGGTGITAYATDGTTKTFEVKASDGSVFSSGSFTTASTTGIGRVQISSIVNPYELNQTWNTIQFYSSNASWSPALVWAAYGSGSPNWGALEMAGPRLGTRLAARISLRSEEQTNTTAVNISANRFYANANDFYWGDVSAGAVSFWLQPTPDQRFQFLNSGGKRTEFRYSTLGANTIVAKENSNDFNRLDLHARDIQFITTLTSGNLQLYNASERSDRPILSVPSINNGLVFANNGLMSTSANGAVFQPMWASNTTTPSDLRFKGDVHEWDDPDLLAKVAALPVKTYRMKVDQDGTLGDRTHLGLIAQELQTVWPESVMSPGEDDDRLHVDVYYLLALLWGSVQQLTAKVDRLSQSPTDPSTEGHDRP